MSNLINTTNHDHMSQPLFFGDNIGIARYDRVKYPWIDKLTDKMNGFHWLPTVRDLTKDGPDFRSMNSTQQHIWLSNIKRQIVLDSIQGRAISQAFMPIASVPELEPLLKTWEYFETIHSRTYTHVIRNVLPDPSIVFDNILNNEEIVKTTANLTKYYDDYISCLNKFVVYMDECDLGWEHFDNNSTIMINGGCTTFRDLKTKFFKCLMSVNILEGLRFYVSFACSFAFAQKNLMEGNAGLIKLICRDENLHVAITQKIIKTLRTEDPFFERLFQDSKKEFTQMFVDTVNEEKEWAEYLFKDGSMIGLNKEILGHYIEYIANRRMKSVGLDAMYKQPTNPLVWMEQWTGSKNVQVAAQETEITSYIIGGVDSDLGKGNNALTGFEL